MKLLNKLKQIKHFLTRRFILESYMGKVNINLGCGFKPFEGFINVDYYNPKFADLLVNLESEKLPWEDNSVDLIYSDNVFEHIQNYLNLIQECYRILKLGGYLIIRVPYFKSKHAFVDPTHRIFFTVQSLDFFVKDTYFFRINGYMPIGDGFSNIEIFFDPENASIIKKIVELYAVKKPNNFENSVLSNIFVFHNIVYVLKK